MMSTYDAKAMNHSERSALMTRYILGQLSEEERARLEEQYFADPDLFEEIVAVENDLIDSYVCGRLSGAELHQFENYFLSSREHQERVEFARSLLSIGQPAEASKASRLPGAVNWRLRLPSPALRLVLAASFLALLACGIWLGTRDMRLSRELAQLRSSNAQLERERGELQQKNAELQAEIAGHDVIPKSEPSPLTRPGEPTMVLTLSADLTRSHGKPNILPLTPGITAVVLMLESDSSYSRYDIALETADGTPALQRKGLKNWATRRGRITSVPLPPGALANGDYVINLIGVTSSGQAHEVDAYSFRVVTSQHSEK